MSSRLELHNLLLSIGGPNVYYQVPSNLTMKYPAIKYSLNKIENKHANNLVYNQDVSYTITVMSKDADEPIVSKISKLPKCSFDRSYIQDNIYHTVFSMYY
jgi:hypothetical protein